MRVLDHLRHSRRDPTGIHLNEEGIELARRVAPTLGRYDRVVTSPKPRAVETAEALGLTVDARLPELAMMPDDVGLSVDELLPRSFADYVSFVHRSETMAEYANDQARLMRDELERLADGGRLLMISHGGIIEFGAAAARPQDAKGFGALLGYLEGVRLTLENGRWVRGEVLRAPK